MNYSTIQSKNESSSLESPNNTTIAQSILDGQEEARIDLEKYQRNHIIKSNEDTIVVKKESEAPS